MEMALSEVVDAPGGQNFRTISIPRSTEKLKAMITALMNMLAKGDFFASRSNHDANISRESPPPGHQSKKNYTNPATEVIPEEEEEDELVSVKQSQINQ